MNEMLDMAVNAVNLVLERLDQLNEKADKMVILLERIETRLGDR
jgi:hypothetical protein